MPDRYSPFCILTLALGPTLEKFPAYALAQPAAYACKLPLRSPRSLVQRECAC